MSERKWCRPNSNIIVQIVRYLLSGGVAFVVDFCLMILLSEWAKIPGALAATISFAVGLVITYLLSVKWIFDKRRFSHPFYEFLTFAIIGAVGLLITYGLMSLLVNSMSVYYIYAKIITTFIVTIWNFMAKKVILFR